jgi:hypothetical protein
MGERSNERADGAAFNPERECPSPRHHHHGFTGMSVTTAPTTAPTPRLIITTAPPRLTTAHHHFRAAGSGGEVEAVEVHDLGPGGDEVVHELFLRI